MGIIICKHRQEDIPENWVRGIVSASANEKFKAWNRRLKPHFQENQQKCFMAKAPNDEDLKISFSALCVLIT